MPDTQSLILLAAAMVAGVVCFRLFQVLGRRTGHEPTAQAPRPSTQDAPKAAAPAMLEAPEATRSAGPSSGGLVAIQLADRSFDKDHFLTGAREAYGRIVRAFAAGDVKALEPLLSPPVLQAFEDAIAARGAARGPAPAATFTALQDAVITGASLEGRHAEITLTFRAGFAPQDGAPHDVTDVWTFARDVDSADPNWTLVATSGEAPE